VSTTHFDGHLLDALRCRVRVTLHVGLLPFALSSSDQAGAAGVSRPPEALRCLGAGRHRVRRSHGQPAASARAANTSLVIAIASTRPATTSAI
jgi:hypothetical protein